MRWPGDFRRSTHYCLLPLLTAGHYYFGRDMSHSDAKVLAPIHDHVPDSETINESRAVSRGDGTRLDRGRAWLIARTR
jgi:hypothetical protein